MKHSHLFQIKAGEDPKPEEYTEYFEALGLSPTPIWSKWECFT